MLDRFKVQFIPDCFISTAMVWHCWFLNWMPWVFKDISIFWLVRTLGIVQSTACLTCSLLSHIEFHPICAQFIMEQMSQMFPVQFPGVFCLCSSINCLQSLAYLASPNTTFCFFKPVRPLLWLVSDFPCYSLESLL